MRTIDNSPLPEPNVGIFVETSEPIWQLEENRLYLLSTASDDIREKVARAIEWILHELDSEEFINTYNYSELDEPLTLEENSKLKVLLAEDQYNFILPIFRPGAEKFPYLLAKATYDNVEETIVSMFYTADRVTRRSFGLILSDKIGNYTEEAFHKLESEIDSHEFLNNFVLYSYIPSHRKFGLRPSLPSLNDALGINSDDSEFTKNQKMIANIKLLVERSKKYHDEEATRALDSIFSNIANRQLLMYALLDDYTPGQIDRFSKSMNLPQKALASDVNIEIEKCPTKDDGYARLKGQKREKVDGEYVLFFKKGKKEDHVRFRDRKCFIVYLIYLIDRTKRGDKVTPINFKEQEKIYKTLYKTVYPKAPGCDSSFSTLTSSSVYDEKEKIYKSRRTKISDCLSEIRNKIGNTCVTLNECPVIHFIPSPNDHICTLPDKIKIPEVLLNSWH